MIKRSTRVCSGERFASFSIIWSEEDQEESIVFVLDTKITNNKALLLSMALPYYVKNDGSYVINSVLFVKTYFHNSITLD